jgi:hypothetical protein
MPFAGRFNVSRQETWESGDWFPRGDHKAVKRLERPRLKSPWEAARMNKYSVSIMA